MQPSACQILAAAARSKFVSQERAFRTPGLGIGREVATLILNPEYRALHDLIRIDTENERKAELQ